MAVNPLANLQDKITHIGLSLVPVITPVLENPHMLFCALDVYVVISCVCADNGDRGSSPNVVGPAGLDSRDSQSCDVLGSESYVPSSRPRICDRRCDHVEICLI